MNITDRDARRVVLPMLTLSVIIASPVRADESVPSAAFRDDRTSIQQMREQAQAAERSGYAHEREDSERAIADFGRAGELFESIAQRSIQPAEVSQAYWRSSRSYWLLADVLPRDAKDRRVSFFLRSESLAEKGIEVDPECAGCMLWKFSAMGRLATARGVWKAGGQIPVMDDLLDRAIALRPTYADDENNSIMGNLQYSSAIFYRVLPDWFFMTWFFGVRGDKDRSLEHIETALALHPSRLDYQVELGSQLLCRGTSSDDAAELAQGMKVMREAVAREPMSLDDEREIEAGEIMLDQPRKACGYSGDTWVEIDRKRAARHVRN